VLPNARAATAAADALLKTLETVLQSVQTQLQIAQGRQAQLANRRRRKAPMYKVGDRVWLSTAETRIAQQAAYKLALHRTAPYEVTQVLSTVVCRLKLPDGSKVHDVFHVSRLTPFVVEDRFGLDVKPRPPNPCAQMQIRCGRLNVGWHITGLLRDRRRSNAQHSRRHTSRRGSTTDSPEHCEVAAKEGKSCNPMMID
jgi:hypothetical protein